jgi:hypothetical protein
MCLLMMIILFGTYILVFSLIVMTRDDTVACCGWLVEFTFMVITWVLVIMRSVAILFYINEVSKGPNE